MLFARNKPALPPRREAPPGLTMQPSEPPPSSPPSALLAQWRQVSVFGLGLIGGSLAVALKRRLPHVRVVGIDVAQAPSALPGGAPPLDGYVQTTDEVAVRASLVRSSAVFLATPVETIIDLLPQVLRWVGAGAVVSDCGSSKRRVMEAVASHPSRGRFVPGHPMAGALGSSSGARGDLFCGRPWVLCSEGSDSTARQAVEDLVRLVGATPERMTASEHDRAVALTSHAPRLVASVVTGLVDRASAFGAAGPAFERLMRAAGGDAAIWSSILRSNGDAVAHALREIAGQLQDCASELERGVPDRALEVLRSADAARARFSAERLGDRRLP